MGRSCFDEYNSELESVDLAFANVRSDEASAMDELDHKRRNISKTRREVENYQERKRLRNDLEFFT